MTIGTTYYYYYYRPQGCFRRSKGEGGGGAEGIETIGLVLGPDHIVPDDAVSPPSSGSNMSLSLCLELCASVNTKTYSYIGVSDGE